ncbi:MAG: septum formation initiator family protein [Chitinophagaceae bacterium]|jgi:cell division protein FtsB|nr:septum formation initiator family protein [Chitinophagaceae bacterium]
MAKNIVFRLKLHYLLALAAFVVWMLFFDEKDVFTQIKRTKELEKIENRIAFYRQEIDQTKKQIEQLDTDPAMLERFAREKYFMKRDNEEVFIMEYDSLKKN